MKKYVLIVGLMLGSVMLVNAQKVQTAEEKANYTDVITKRASKIVDVLGITDSVKYKHVRDIVVDQYRNLGTIHDNRNMQVATINEEKKQPGADKAAENAKIAAIDTDVIHQLARLHHDYLSKLGKILTAEQVDKVKDEMTYKILEVTYAAYLDELPQLTAPQKDKIKGWLVEARELAIDAESSNKKHEVFGKYKGRINNYLSSQGYDMKKAGEEWQKRIKEKQGDK
ncbi:MAG: DUF3826 domain-containing protein [Mucilaginibacter sp.]